MSDHPFGGATPATPFMALTSNSDAQVVRMGDRLTATGWAVPGSTVLLCVAVGTTKEFKKTTANAGGQWQAATPVPVGYGRLRVSVELTLPDGTRQWEELPTGECGPDGVCKLPTVGTNPAPPTGTEPELHLPKSGEIALPPPRPVG